MFHQTTERSITPAFRTVSIVLLLASSLLSGSCSTPAPTTPTVPPPPDANNTPPLIVSITTSASRVDAGDSITLSAIVQDAETPLSQLVYEWSAAPLQGTFTGSGTAVNWQAPNQQATPDVYTFTLKVTEPFTSGGQAKQNVVSLSAQVHYNNSTVEMNALATDFLVNRFGNFNVSPEQCVANFSDSCGGKAAELSDIQANRQFFHIISATFSPALTTFNGNKTSGRVVGPCVFEDTVTATGVRERVTGECTLTEVYENFRWFLCDSGFQSTAPTVPFDRLRYRVPGLH